MVENCNSIPDITQRFPEGFGGPYMSDKELEWREKMSENKRRLKEASENGSAVYFADDCVGCKNYESIGPTHQSDWDVDDVEHGICHDCSITECEYRKKYNTQ